MLSLLIFVILIFNAATHPNPDPPVITFNIQIELSKDSPVLTCDHSKEKAEQNLYTVYEGGQFTIVTKYNSIINHVLCLANSVNDPFKPVKRNVAKSETTFTGEKIMGTLWQCTILAHRDYARIHPMVYYKDSGYDEHIYSAAYCYMTIHVRQKEAPHTILVNNMELSAVRTNLSQKHVDFVAEYQYVDGDVVNVICINKLSDKMLTMKYNMAGTVSDESTMDDLSSRKMIGISIKLYAEHSNSYMICTRIEKDDFTKVMVRFVMRTNYNILSLKINGMFVRPHLCHLPNNQYSINYKYEISQLINVTCEVERTDVKLLLFDEDFDNKSRYKNTELIKNKKVEMKFYLSSAETNKKLECATDYLNGTSAETVAIYFTEAVIPIEQYPLHMELPSNGRVMEVFNDFKLNVIFYEFKDGETLQLTCGQLPRHPPSVPPLYLELDSDICDSNGCNVFKQKDVTRKDENTEIACYLKEQPNPSEPNPNIVLREIRVILRERIPTTIPTPILTTNRTAANPTSSETTTNNSNNDTLLYSLTGVGVVLIVIIFVVLYYTIIKKRCCVRSSAPIPAPKIDPASVFYENLLAVFRPINEREAAEIDENHYEEIE